MPTNRNKSLVQFEDEIELMKGFRRFTYAPYQEAFYGKAAGTLPSPWVATKTGTSTNNTVSYASSVANGVFRLTHSSDSEAQTMRLDWGDSLQINLSKGPIVRFRLKLNITGAAMSADQRMVIGLVSAYNSTLDSITSNLMFRMEGANLNVYVEGDDGTTDTDDQDTTFDFVDNTYYTFEIDCTSLASVKFRIYNSAGVLVNTSSVAVAAMAANTLVQPIVCIQRDAGTEEEVVDIDDFCLIAETRT